MTRGICFPAGRALVFAMVMTLVVALLAGCGSESLPAGCVASRENDKYCLDHDDSVLVEGSDGEQVELYRVVALQDIVMRFPGRQTVKVADRGNRGGYVEGEWNLSLDGPAWVGDEAVVHGRATVSENAFVYGNAQVSGTAQIFGNALVFGNARVLDGAKVYDRAEIYGDAIVFDRAASVFEPDDPARKFWNDSLTLDHSMGVEFSYVNDAFSGAGGEDDPYRDMLLWSAEDYGYAYAPEPYRPTEIFMDAHVLGDSRVWGGTHLYGNTRIAGTTRISGGSLLSALHSCGALWVNAQRNWIGSHSC